MSAPNIKIAQDNPRSGNIVCNCIVIRSCFILDSLASATVKGSTSFTGPTQFVNISANSINVDVINERTQNAGVTIEGVLIKDNTIGPSGVNAGLLYNIPISSTVPTNGQTLVYNSGLNEWAPGSSGGGGPSAYTTQLIYVRKGGNDISGNGTITAPYATITYAMSTITDALWEKRYVIDLGPGNWSDNFSWKAWVFIRGSTVLATRLTGSININDLSWAFPGSHSDERSGAQNLNFSGTMTLDFSFSNSQYGKFYYWNCNMNNNLVITGVNPINQCIVEGGFWFGGITASGVAITWNGVSGQGGTVALTSSSIACSFTAFGGGTVGNLSITTVSGLPPTSTLIDCPILGSLTLSGAGSQLSATVSSLPLKNQITNVGGTIILLSDAYSLAYVPTNLVDWNGVGPSTVQAALDRIAAKIGPIP